MAFESKEEAIKRHDESSNSGKPKKNAVGRFDKMTWDKDALKREVQGYDDNIQVNWSSLAVKYAITNTKGERARNGGQIAKEYVESAGVDTTRFKRKSNGDHDFPRIRKKKRKGAGGEISIPTPSTNEELRNS